MVCQVQFSGSNRLMTNQNCRIIKICEKHTEKMKTVSSNLSLKIMWIHWLNHNRFLKGVIGKRRSRTQFYEININDRLSLCSVHIQSALMSSKGLFRNDEPALFHSLWWEVVSMTRGKFVSDTTSTFFLTPVKSRLPFSFFRFSIYPTGSCYWQPLCEHVQNLSRTCPGLHQIINSDCK